jgi:thiol-disulfide isomerase/thioredoxin
MRRSVAVAIVVSAVLVAGAGVWLVVGREGSAADDPTGPVAMNVPLPTISGRSLTGGELSTDELRGTVSVINVWATWCRPCRREQPALARLAADYGDRVKFMGINYRDDRVAAKRWAQEEFSVPYPSISDPDGRSAFLLKFSLGIPDTYIVDGGGTIRWAILGETDAHEVQGLVDQLLAEPSPSGSSSSA